MALAKNAVQAVQCALGGGSGWRTSMSAADYASHVLGMEGLFRREEAGRGAYLSRLFAFLSEEVVRHWSACEAAAYRDVGRPVIWNEDRSARHVLDFTLERRADGHRFVAEMKCEIEFEGYRYLTLDDSSVISHHEPGMAFQRFLRLSRDPSALPVTVAGRPQEVSGTILVWGVVPLRDVRRPEIGTGLRTS